ncbi:MAG: hypothetical protein PQ975_04955 [Methanobacterium sp.]
MKRQMVFMAAALIFVLVICGAVSANETHDIGTQVTKNAGTDLGITNSTSSDDTLLITTAGSASYKGGSTEDSLQGVLDTTSAITPGNGNMVTLNDPNGALEFIFVKKSGNEVFARRYTPIPSGNAFTINSSNTVYLSNSALVSMNEAQWNNIKQELGINAFEIVSIASAWANGAPKDLLKFAGTSGGVSEGLLSGYVKAKSFQNNFPLMNSAQSYHVMTTPGGGDDNVPMTILSVNPAQWVRQIPNQSDPLMINYQSMINGDPLESAYIWWDRSGSTTSPGNGIMAVMKFNSSLLNEYGKPVTGGGLEQIKFLQWLYTQKNIFSGNMGLLISVDSLKKMNQSDFNYLWGHVVGTTYTPGHGIDRTYINKLENSNHQYDKNTGILTTSDYNTLKNIGEQAALMAEAAFGSKLTGEDLVITSAGYTLLKDEQGKLTRSTLGALDGIRSVTGSTIDNFLSLSRSIWTPLWFAFVKKSGNLPNVVLNTVFIEYNAATGLRIVPVTYGGTDLNVFDIGLNSNLAGSRNSEGWNKSVAVERAYTNNRAYNIQEYAQQDFYVVAVANLWAHGVPYELLAASVGGACPGSGFTQGYVIADYVRRNFPLNSHYIHVGFPAHCKEMVINHILGTSAAEGTYFTPGVRIRNTNTAGIFILWNEATNTGKAILLEMDRNIINTMQNQDIPNNNHFYQTAYWALWYVDKAIPGKERYAELLKAFNVTKDISLTQKDLNTMLAAGSDPQAFMMNFVAPVPVTPTAPTPTAPEPRPVQPVPVTPTAPEPQSLSVHQGTGIMSGITQAVSGIREQTAAPGEIAPGLPLGDAPAQAPTASGIPVVPLAGAVLLAAILVLVYLGRESITSAIRRSSEKLGK